MGRFAEGDAEEVAPQAALHRDGGEAGVLEVERREGGDVAAVGRAVGAEMLAHGLAVGDLVLLGGEGVVAQPLVEGDPAAGLLEPEGVGVGGARGAGARPAQKPVLPVGQDPHADPALLLRLGQVAVELLDVARIGLDTRPDADLALDERVEGGQVDGAAGAERGMLLLDDLLGLGQPRRDEEVAHRAGDVGLRLAALVPLQDGGRA